MQLLKDRIRRDGITIDNRIIKVDNFLNHQLDIRLFNEMGKEFRRLFSDASVNKILTVEASGIGIACITAQYFDVPVVFARKTISSNLDVDTYQAPVYSYTKDTHYTIRVAKQYLNPEDHVLIIDDFLANGNAVCGMLDIVLAAGAKIAGIGIVIEKSFQGGRKKLEPYNVRIESLAIIDSLFDGKITFAE